METYYAIFTKEKGGWCVRFPDAEINTEGKTLEEAVYMAADALSGILVVGRLGRDYQPPRSYEEVKDETAEGELVFPVLAREELMEEYRPKKRVNMMVPVDLLDRVDRYVKENPDVTSRSQFFCDGAEKALGI